MKDYILGVLGGMGPEATSYFFQQLIKATPAQKDADHIKTIIYNNPQIPDRTQAIVGKGITPANEMIQTALALEKIGVNEIFIPCITAHFFVQEVQQYIHTPILNLLKILQQYLKINHQDVVKVGILCTTGTKNSQIFDRELETYHLIYPDDFYQENYVMEAVYGEKGIKAGFTTGIPSEKLAEAAKHLKEKGAEIIMMGCTEIPLAFREDMIDIPVMNALKIAAEYIVERVKKQ
ncbi:cysteate racemase [Thermotalea metallivorans]|uniref:Aspartate racemase n=1 Tax=Thermotalea metallivorans TaxID=520762 RepID=A0A140L1J8_9FIRM|nr:amino acid racemase [Thermotalea metallivorans]KXG74423.1 Aspartate racemase [Thermotalea metallivorans]